MKVICGGLDALHLGRVAATGTAILKMSIDGELIYDVEVAVKTLDISRDYDPVWGPSPRMVKIEGFVIEPPAKPADFPCHARPREEWCDREGPGGFMGHTCEKKTEGQRFRDWFQSMVDN